MVVKLNKLRYNVIEVIILNTHTNELDTKTNDKHLNETICLSSIPNFIENINSIRENEDWDLAREFNSKEEW